MNHELSDIFKQDNQQGFLRFVLIVQQQNSGCSYRFFCLHSCQSTNCSTPLVKGTRVAFYNLDFVFFCFFFLFFRLSLESLLFCLMYGIVYPACLLVEMNESEVALHGHAKTTVTQLQKKIAILI